MTDLNQSLESPSGPAESNQPEFQFVSLTEANNILFEVNSIANYLLLSLSLLFTFIFLVDFFYFRIYNAGGELANEEKGVQSIMHAMMVWWRYNFFVVTFALARLTITYWYSFVFFVLSVFVWLWCVKKIILASEHSIYFGWHQKLYNMLFFWLRK